MKLHRLIRRAAILLCLCLVLPLCGCSMLNSSDLLTLPMISPEHQQLLKLINGVTGSTDWVTTNPAAGNNRLTTQFVDFYGDGIPEAVAFFKNTPEFRLRVTVYSKSGVSSYAELCSVEMNGEQIQRVEYADLDGDGSQEMLVGVRYDTAALYTLYAFSLRNGSAAELLNVTYNDFTLCDLLGDGRKEIFTIRDSEVEGAPIAELFHCEAGIMSSVGTAPVSPCVRTPLFLTSGRLNSDTPAIIAEGSFTDASTDAIRYLSDVFIWQEEEGFRNLSYAEIFGQSFETQRSVSLRFSDVNADGSMEFPIAVTMAQPASNPTAVPAGSAIRWYGYDPTGDVSAVADTWLSGDGTWMLTLPKSWRDCFYAQSRTKNDRRLVVFSADDENGAPVELLSICICSNADNIPACTADGYERLAEYGGIWYGVLLNPDAPPALGLKDRADVQARMIFLTAEKTYVKAR